MTPRQSGQQKKRFLDIFRFHGNISKTCRAMNLNRSTVYEWQETDEVFLHDFRQAEIEATESLEAEAYRRGVEGVEKPIYHQGVAVGSVMEYSDTLLIFMLKARAPEKYRDKPPEELSPERVLRFVEAVMTSVKQHVGDPGVLAAIGSDLDRLNVRNGGKPVAPRRLNRG